MDAAEHIGAPSSPFYKSEGSKTGMKDFPIYLSGGRRAVLRVPEEMAPGDLELLRTQINHSLTITEATTTIVEGAYSPARGE